MFLYSFALKRNPNKTQFCEIAKILGCEGHETCIEKFNDRQLFAWDLPTQVSLFAVRSLAISPPKEVPEGVGDLGLKACHHPTKKVVIFFRSLTVELTVFSSSTVGVTLSTAVSWGGFSSQNHSSNSLREQNFVNLRVIDRHKTINHITPPKDLLRVTLTVFCTATFAAHPAGC